MAEIITYAWWIFAFRWFHVLSAIMWIGLLWYFNFVQTPTMPKIPAELKPGVGKFILPEALFWFRWGAMATIVTGLILAGMNGYLADAVKLGIDEHHHVVQRLVHHLAEPEEGARHHAGGRRREEGGGAHRRPHLAHQHPAVDPDALLHAVGQPRRVLAARDPR